MAMQYIGARYVPIVYTNPDDGSADWKSGVPYEPLTIVTYNGDSYTSKKSVPNGVGNPADNSVYWVKTGDFNASLLALQNRVSTVEQDLNNPTTGLKVKVNDIEEQNGNEPLETEAQTLSGGINEVNTIAKGVKSEFEKHLLIEPHNLTGNLVIDYFHTGANVQGACYVGDNKVVAYFVNSDSNTGTLRCFDIENKTIEWEHSIQGYHGNSLCYRALDNCIYICGMARTGEDLFNKIVVVDLAHPTVVKEEITAPVDTLYSIAYDADNDKFYSINSRGNVEGIANKLYAYNGVFESVDYSVDLENSIVVKNHMSWQGVAFAKDGVVYGLQYQYGNRYICGYDAVTGECVLLAKQPDVINGYRAGGESQAIVYDFDNDRYFIFASYNNTGFANYHNSMLYEIDLFKSIDAIEYNIVDSTEGYIKRPSIVVNENLLTELTPYNNTTITRLKCPNDAMTLAIRSGRNCSVTIVTDIVVTPILNGFIGTLQGESASHPLKLGDIGELQFVNCRFLWCDFTSVHSGYTVYAHTNCILTFLACQFEDTETTTIHIMGNNHCDIYYRNTDCIFNSDKRKFRAGQGSVIRNNNTGGFAGTAGNNYTSTADTYVDSGASITVENYTKEEISVSNTHNSSTPIGVIIKDVNGNTEYCYESSDASNTPVFVLGTGTHNVWVKYSGAGTEKATIYHKTIDIGI